MDAPETALCHPSQHGFTDLGMSEVVVHPMRDIDAILNPASWKAPDRFATPAKISRKLVLRDPKEEEGFGVLREAHDRSGGEVVANSDGVDNGLIRERCEAGPFDPGEGLCNEDELCDLICK